MSSQFVSRRVVARGRSPDRIPEDPRAVWLRGFDVDSQPAAASQFDRFMVWLHSKEGWEYVTPRDILIRHIQAEDEYVVLEVVEEYIGQLHAKRKSSKRKAYSTIRSYFSHSYCPLPADPNFRIHGDKPPVQGRLTVQDIYEAALAAATRNRSIILVKWQGFFDSSRLAYVNLHCADQIVHQIQTHQCPVRIDLAGRKENENDPEGAFYTYIHQDAINALTKYWDEEHCWPKPGQPLWLREGLNRGKGTINKAAIEAMWLRAMRHSGKIPRSLGPVGSRYGYNMHEMRDAAATYLHVKAKANGLDMDCVKFWSGRTGELDPNKYDKFYQETEWVLSQYMIAGEHLNIITNPPSSGGTEEVKAMAKENEQLRGQMAKVTQDMAQLRGEFEKAFEKKLTD